MCPKLFGNHGFDQVSLYGLSSTVAAEAAASGDNDVMVQPHQSGSRLVRCYCVQQQQQQTQQQQLNLPRRLRELTRLIRRSTLCCVCVNIYIYIFNLVDAYIYVHIRAHQLESSGVVRETKEPCTSYILQTAHHHHHHHIVNNNGENVAIG